MEDGKPRATIEVIPLDSIRANPMNPRTHFGTKEEVAELIAEFDENPVYPGEPWDPICVVRDGNVYRIADGECRWRAMRKAGKVTECHARVFDRMEDAAVMLMALDTNRKRALTDGEYGFGLQTALMLGVDEAKVERRAGRECAAGLRRQMKRAGGKAVQMSVDQMLAADEFADDEEAYEKIVKAGAGDWRYEAQRLRRKRDSDRARAEAEEAAAGASAAFGLQVLDRAPKGAVLERTLYGGAADAIRKDGGEWADSGFVLVRPHSSGHGYMTSWEVYGKPPERTPEQEAAATVKSELRRQAQKARRRRLEWVADRMKAVGAMHGLVNVRRLVRDYVVEMGMYDAEKFCKKADMDSDFFNDSGAYRIPSEYVIAMYWERIDAMTNAEVDAVGDGTAADGSWARKAAERHVKVVNAMRQDGYKPGDDEQAFLSLCIQAQGGGK